MHGMDRDAEGPQRRIGEIPPQCGRIARVARKVFVVSILVFYGSGVASAQGECAGVGFDPTGDVMPVQITNRITGATYCGTGIRQGFNPFTLSDEYTFTALSESGLAGISGTYDVTVASMAAAQLTGVYDLSNIIVDDSWGSDDGGGSSPPYIDSPPDPGAEQETLYYALWIAAPIQTRIAQATFDQPWLSQFSEVVL